MSKGETNLKEILATLRPVLNDGLYVFTTVKKKLEFSGIDIICSMREKEGITLVLAKEDADKLGLPYDFIASWITLNVHSSLSAVGLTATFSSVLAENGISCNVIAGFYHDHIFVDEKKREIALDVLLRLTYV